MKNKITWNQVKNINAWDGQSDAEYFFICENKKGFFVSAQVDKTGALIKRFNDSACYKNAVQKCEDFLL